MRWVALACRVLAVAVEGEVGDWAAYVDAVEGEDHDREWQAVAKSGEKMSREVAELLFPDFKDLRWRY